MTSLWFPPSVTIIETSLGQTFANFADKSYEFEIMSFIDDDDDDDGANDHCESEVDFNHLQVVAPLMLRSWLCICRYHHPTILDVLSFKQLARHLEVCHQWVDPLEQRHAIPHRLGQGRLLPSGEGSWQVEAAFSAGSLSCRVDGVQLCKLGLLPVIRLEGVDQLVEKRD